MNSGMHFCQRCHTCQTLCSICGNCICGKNQGITEMMKSNKDMLKRIFELQESLMREYQARTPDSIPEWPIDIKEKSLQRFCRDTLSKGQDELFEAKSLLRLAKEHRNVTDLGQFEREEFLEEMVDALHFYVEVLILVGFNANDLYGAYYKKNILNRQRIDQEFGQKDENSQMAR